MKSLCASAGAWFTGRSLSKKVMARLCIAWVVLLLLPMLAACFYDYPADDDFQFVWDIAPTWMETHSLTATLGAIAQSVRAMYMTWQGTFMSTLYIYCGPLLFGVEWYFLSPLFLILLLFGSAAYFCRGLCKRLLQTDTATFWIVYAGFVTLLTQFLPSVSEVFYWHTGGIYNLGFCSILLAAGSLLAYEPQRGPFAKVWRYVFTLLCALNIGGGVYPTALAGTLALTLITVYALYTRKPVRWLSLAAALVALAALVLMVTAPGNALRQERVGAPSSVLDTLIRSVTNSMSYASAWCTPALAAVVLVTVLALWQPLKQSTLQFKHPFWFLVFSYGVFAASFAPSMYATQDVSARRVADVIYFFFQTVVLLNTVYLTGWAARRFAPAGAGREPSAEGRTALGARFTALTLAVALGLMAWGAMCMPLNHVTSLSAAKTLATGELAQYYGEMKQREQMIRDADGVEGSSALTIEPPSIMPYVFLEDKLYWQGIYGPRCYMKWYFDLYK